MNLKDFPQRWRDKIKDPFGELTSRFDELGNNIFQTDLRISFYDGSNAFFKNSFYAVDSENYEIAVFSEKCGYHIFPLYIKIETFDKEGNIVKTEDFKT